MKKQAQTTKVQSDSTLTRADLSAAVHREVGLSRSESAELVDWLIHEISEELVRNNTVKITNFGSFNVRQKKERVGRNPKTGIEVPISARRVLSFRPSNILKEKLNNNDS